MKYKYMVIGGVVIYILGYRQNNFKRYMSDDHSSSISLLTIFP